MQSFHTCLSKANDEPWTRYPALSSGRSYIVPTFVEDFPNSTIHHAGGEQENYYKNKAKQITLYKTEYCRNWTELGQCRYGKKCRYAHGDNELRTVPRHNRYKTQICLAYHLQGSCRYGIRCTFIHDTEAKPTKTTSSPVPYHIKNLDPFGVWNSKLGLATDYAGFRNRRYSLGSNSSCSGSSTSSSHTTEDTLGMIIDSTCTTPTAITYSNMW